MPSNEKRIVTAATLEREVGIPRGTIYRLAKAGLIPVYRVGRSYRASDSYRPKSFPR